MANYKLPTEGIVRKGGPVSEKDAKFFYEFFTEIAQNAKIISAELYKELDTEVTEKGPLNWGWVQAILRAVDKKRKMGCSSY